MTTAEEDEVASGLTSEMYLKLAPIVDEFATKHGELGCVGGATALLALAAVLTVRMAGGLPRRQVLRGFVLTALGVFNFAFEKGVEDAGVGT